MVVGDRWMVPSPVRTERVGALWCTLERGTVGLKKVVACAGIEDCGCVVGVGVGIGTSCCVR